MTHTNSRILRPRSGPCRSGASTLLALALAACSGDDGDRGPAGPPGSGGTTPTEVGIDQDAPGIELEIVALTGGTGPGGSFEIGDRISVRFTATKHDGSPWQLSEFSRGRILVSGPTDNYQRVIAERSDVLTLSTLNADGSFTYRFPVDIPAVYLAPLNDTATFGASDGELTGQPLLNGTYSLGMYVGWEYTVGEDAYRDADDAFADFRIGPGVIEPREVVSLDNCNQCHGELQAHGGMRRDVRLCLLCHTSGAEDKNDPLVAGGTPDVTIDFKVMIHKIHDGSHLPSVLGVATLPNGARDYAAVPKPYQIAGFGGSLHDYSGVGFPVMPSAYVAYTYDATGVNYTGAFGNGPMPRDTGYSALTGPRKLVEDKIRSGAVACDKCHGDADGSGPLAEPAQGARYSTHPTRSACGSCHDDVDWHLPYASNGQTMPDQMNDSDCSLCHEPSGTLLSVADAHRHPYSDPAFNTGVNIGITGVAGGTGPGGNHVSGDPIQVTFSVTDDTGADLSLATLTRFQMIVSGPTSNPQWVMPNVNPFDFAFRKSSPFTGNGTASAPTVGAGALAQTIAVVFTASGSFDVVGSSSPALVGVPIGTSSGSVAAVAYQGVSFNVVQGSTAFAAGDRFYFEVVPLASSYTMYVPRDVSFERLGDATGGADVLPFAEVPAAWGRQVVYERTSLTGSAVSLTEDLPAMGRYAACDATLVSLAVGDRVVLDEGTPVEEYLQVGRVQSTDDFTGADLGARDRVWFTTGLRYAHDLAGSIQECTLSTKREGIAYTMPAANATEITLVAGQFGSGNPVVASYRAYGRFGFRSAPGEAWQDLYPPVATGDTDDIDVTWGDWKGLPIVDGTYRVGMWANRDFTVSPMRASMPVEAFNNIATDNTTYRMMAPPAVSEFLYGAATSIEPRAIVESESCNRCHGDLAAHGFGRRGLETCLMCHSTPGAEDGSKYSFSSWYVGPTPGVTMDFRTLLHKVHMGEHLANASSYVVNGVFLGSAYPVRYDEVVFPALPSGTRDCSACHGESNDAWRFPADRDHPTVLTAPTREWRAVCGACHDSEATSGHIDAQTSSNGVESCDVCHGDGKEWNVRRVHKVR